MKKIIAYHGSPNLFKKFEFNRIGTNDGTTGAGLGFYFTDNPEGAERYGKYVYECELRLQKKLDNNKLRVFNNTTTIQKFINILYKRFDVNYYENFGFDMPFKLISNYDKSTICNDLKVSCDSDTELIMDIFNAGGISEQDFLSILLGWSYNHTTDTTTARSDRETHTIHYNPDQIRIINIINK